MKQYLELLQDVLDNGSPHHDRTGTGTRRVFGRIMRFDLEEGFPLLTTKQIHMKSVIHELLWFLSGDTNVKYLQDNGVTIWDEWADEQGELGPIYSHQWRNFGERKITIHENIQYQYDMVESGVDQINQLVSSLISNPDSRRHIVTAWNPNQIDQMALPPCHCFFQCHVDNGKLSLQLYQRSCDVFLGVPFNIASYALLTMMLAQVCKLGIGELIWVGGDVHLYNNHIKQAKEQLERTPLPLPDMKLNPKTSNIFNFLYDDFTLENYEHYPPIKAEVSV